ncbi:MAG: coproporphyrinogen dehydrogenase HemZ [Mogibacterium sp.]|nr:coproporphyrinogen dehydrogenase HemZ [Mogibacterium sp.]
MYRFYINNTENEYHYMELARVFLPDDSFEVIAYTGNKTAKLKDLLRDGSYLINAEGSDDRDEVKRELYRLLSDLTGEAPPWGTLTGVRPLKPALEEARRSSVTEMRSAIELKYLMSKSKSSLIADIADYQLRNVSGRPYDKASLYIGIPFCPTRCSYCSFASNVASAADIESYLNDLLKEIEYSGSLAVQHGVQLESIYIGGGTPTTLEAGQLELLINTVSDSFGIDASALEFTVEAGRPDTITALKLETLKSLGIDRISINPQSMKDETLRAIGREHTADDIRQGFLLARDAGFDVINADLIAGLPGEDEHDFEGSLKEVIELGAENITVHTLSVKKGSRLRDSDPEYYRRNTATVSNMLDISRDMLTEAGFCPYYIYRQKHQMGAFENVGWCKPGKHSIYNIRIMEDKQTIIGLGAGAVGKVYYPDGDRLERIANVSNYKIYSERFDEMLARKDEYYDQHEIGGKYGYQRT